MYFIYLICLPINQLIQERLERTKMEERVLRLVCYNILADKYVVGRGREGRREGGREGGVAYIAPSHQGLLYYYTFIYIYIAFPHLSLIRPLFVSYLFILF